MRRDRNRKVEALAIVVRLSLEGVRGRVLT
jgi:hypothetical protein